MSSSSSFPVRSLVSPGSSGFSDNFIVSNKSFTQQFAAIYFLRLNKLKAIVLSCAQRQINHLCGDKPFNPVVCQKIIDLDGSEEFFLIAGTLYKEMKLKPTILDEYSENKLDAHPETTLLGNYCDSEDSLALEDEFGRISLTQLKDEEEKDDRLPEQLKNPLNIQQLSSGIVVAVLGRESRVQKGKFHAFSIFLPDFPPQIPRLISGKSLPPKYILMVSGLQIGNPDIDPANSPISLLTSYLTGYFGSSQEKQFISSIARVLIAGNSLYRPKTGNSHNGAAYIGNSIPINGNTEGKADYLTPLKEFDLFLTALSSSLDVDLLPGSSDPSNFTFPQQPLHKCLFPSAGTFSTFHSRTNPAYIPLENLLILATSGQNIEDLLRYTQERKPIELLEDCLRARNIAPTAPDTLSCYPFQDNDPFIIQSAPHLAVVGNQEKFETSYIHLKSGESTEPAIRCICLPDFSKTGIAVLVNIHSPTLECETLEFDLSRMRNNNKQENMED